MEIHKKREGVFKYDLLLRLEGKGGRPIPEELKPRISEAYEKLFDKVDVIFSEYEEEQKST